MKILIIEGVASPNYGGAEKSMSRFCEYLKSLDYQVYVICEKYDPAYSISVENTCVLNLQPIRNQGITNYLTAISRVVRFVKDRKIELILTHCIHNMPLLRIVKILSGVKLMVYFKWIYNQKSIGRFNSWGLAGFDRYVAINKFVGNYWIHQKKNIAEFDIVPDGVDFPVGSFKTIGDQKSTKNILYFGRIIRGKGLHILIQSLRELDNSYRLTILGEFRPFDINFLEHEYHHEIECLVQNSGFRERVRFIGLVDNVIPYINDADLVVVPSIIDDAQPFSILESFANGCPAIGTNRGGIPYIYEEDDFWYCEPNRNDLATKIESILGMEKNELLEMTKQMHVDLRQRYNRSETEKLLRQVCDSTIG